MSESTTQLIHCDDGSTWQVYPDHAEPVDRPLIINGSPRRLLSCLVLSWDRIESWLDATTTDTLDEKASQALPLQALRRLKVSWACGRR